jgi:hypothetical protein
MSMTSNVTSILIGLGVQFPLITVCFLGLVLTLMQMQRLPRVSLLVAAGLGLLLVAAVVQPLVQPLLYNFILRDLGRNMNPQTRGLMLSGISLAFNLPRAIATGLLAYAAFVERPLQALLSPVPVPKAWPGVASVQPLPGQPPYHQNVPGNLP